MTVIIGALAEKGKKLVGVADKMLSLQQPVPYQYETDEVTKIYTLSDKAILMAAGNTILADEIAQLAIQKVSESPDEDFQGVCNLVSDAYHQHRRQIIEDAVLKPRDLTYSQYLEAQQNLHQDVVTEVERTLTEFNPGVELIIAGYDSKGDCHICALQHPGVLSSYDVVGYVCLGIGGPHAQLSLIDSEYKKTLSLNEVKELVHQAKKRAERAPGVGQKTDEIILPVERRQNG